MYPICVRFQKKFKDELPTKDGIDFLKWLVHKVLHIECPMTIAFSLLAPCPERRISAKDAIQHDWFSEDPLPVPPEGLPVHWPVRSERNKRPVHVSP